MIFSEEAYKLAMLAAAMVPRENPPETDKSWDESAADSALDLVIACQAVLDTERERGATDR